MLRLKALWPHSLMKGYRPTGSALRLSGDRSETHPDRLWIKDGSVGDPFHLNTRRGVGTAEEAMRHCMADQISAGIVRARWN